MDGAQSLAIGTLTLAPSNPEILFVGTGEQTFSASSFFGVGIYRIENASSANPTISGPINRDTGNNDVFSGRAIGEILVHPTDPNIIFVSTTSGIGGIGPAQPGNVPNRGLFRSTNAMSAAPSFAKLAVTSLGVGENRAIVDLVMDPGNPNRIVASVVGTAAIATTNPPTPADNGGLFLTLTRSRPFLLSPRPWTSPARLRLRRGLNSPLPELAMRPRFMRHQPLTPAQFFVQTTVAKPGYRPSITTSVVRSAFMT